DDEAGDEGATAEDGETADGEGNSETETTASALPGSVSVDADVHAGMMRRLEYLEAQEAKRVRSSRIGRVDAAIAAGKTTPARRKAWITACTGANAEASLAELEAREPGMAVPIGEVGRAAEVEASHLGADRGYPLTWLTPDEQRAVREAEAASGGGRS